MGGRERGRNEPLVKVALTSGPGSRDHRAYGPHNTHSIRMERGEGAKSGTLTAFFPGFPFLPSFPLLFPFLSSFLTPSSLPYSFQLFYLSVFFLTFSFLPLFSFFYFLLSLPRFALSLFSFFIFLFLSIFCLSSISLSPFLLSPSFPLPFPSALPLPGSLLTLSVSGQVSAGNPGAEVTELKCEQSG